MSVHGVHGWCPQRPEEDTIALGDWSNRQQSCHVSAENRNSMFSAGATSALNHRAKPTPQLHIRNIVSASGELGFMGLERWLKGAAVKSM